MPPPYILDRKGSKTPIAPEDVSRAVEAGAVVVAPGAFKRAGYHEKVLAGLRAVVAQTAGEGAARKLQAAGPEKIHEILTGPEIATVWRGLLEMIRPQFVHVGRKLGREILGWPEPFYVNFNTVLRFMAPHRVLQENYAAYSKHLGKLDLHGPHHDVWQNVVLNAINVWIALGPVREDNGMAVYPDHWGQTMPRGASHIRDDQRTGEPIRFACDAGDIILFHGHHLHGSVLNRSDATRLVITTRLTREAPAFPDGSRQMPYFYSDRIAGGDANKALYQPGRVPDAVLPPPGEAPLNPPAHPRDLAEGEIMAVDARTCMARVDGKLFAFGRRCPHQGADLACGHIADGRVRCPWHDYPFDPATGRGDGDVLRPIRALSAEEGLRRFDLAQTAGAAETGDAAPALEPVD